MKEYRIRLWELMAERRLKTSDVERDTGLSHPTLHKIKHGKSKSISFNVLDTLCNYFNITPAELFSEVKPVKTTNPIYKETKEK